MRVLGVDPGGRHTGIALSDRVSGEDSGMVITRDAGETIDAYAARAAKTITGLLATVDLCAVEGWRHPNPHLGIANMTGLLDAVFVAGYFTAEAASSTVVVLVPPGGHGSSPLAAYPHRLVGPGETTGTGKLRHARSAHDIARAGLVIYRQQGAA